MLGGDAFVSKLVSPAQAEKLLGREKAKAITDLWQKPDGKPTVVPDSDPRPEIITNHADYFSDIEVTDSI